MKKSTALRMILVLMVVILISTFLTGCGKPKTERVKTGLAVITTLDKSTNAGDKPGLAQVDSTVVAVTVDNSGKIVKCVIDAVQSKINFDASGKLITPMDTLFPTKNELGEAYGMKKASKIGKEWNEQAAAFAKYVTGKTPSEVKNIAVDAQERPTGSDLRSQVTIGIGDFQAALAKAAR